MSRRTILMSAPSSGWKSFCKVTPAGSSSFRTIDIFSTARAAASSKSRTARRPATRATIPHYLVEREERREIQQRAYDNQQRLIAKTEEFIRKNLAGQKTKQAKSRRTMLQKLERVDAVRADQAAGDFRLTGNRAHRHARADDQRRLPSAMATMCWRATSH